MPAKRRNVGGVWKISRRLKTLKPTAKTSCAALAPIRETEGTKPKGKSIAGVMTVLQDEVD
jgi:hypothetical protein